MTAFFALLTLLLISAVIFFSFRWAHETSQLVPMIMSVITAMTSAFATFKSRKADMATPALLPPKKPLQLGSSLKSALLGGLIGGGAAGLLNGVLYYISF